MQTVFVECISKTIKTTNKDFFKYIRSSKQARETVRPLENNRIKGVLEEDKVVDETQNEFFSSVFTSKDRQEEVPLRMIVLVNPIVVLLAAMVPNAH